MDNNYDPMYDHDEGLVFSGTGKFERFVECCIALICSDRPGTVCLLVKDQESKDKLLQRFKELGYPCILWQGNDLYIIADRTVQIHVFLETPPLRGYEDC